MAALEFLFQWSVRFLEEHSATAHIRPASIHMSLSILERITARPLWVHMVQRRAEGRLVVLCNLLMRLLCTCLEQQEGGDSRLGFDGSTITKLALSILHNVLLVFAVPQRSVGAKKPLDELDPDWIQTPWLFELIQHQNLEVSGIRFRSTDFISV